MDTPSYQTSGTGRRVVNWNPNSEGINTLVSANAEALRNKARDSVRRNAWAESAVSSFVNQVVGTGVVPVWSGLESSEKSRIQEMWLDWTDQSDPQGVLDFYGQQAQAVRAVIEAGEVFARPRFRRTSDGLTVPLQVQMIEADHVPLWKNETLSTGTIKAGIEFDKIGRRVAYHMYRDHPGELVNSASNMEIVRVPADGVLHMFCPTRPGQVRGVTMMAQALLTLHELEKYDGAEMARKAAAAMIVFFEQDLDSYSAPGVAAIGSDEGEDTSGIPLTGLEPGSYVTLPSGKKVSVSEPADVGGMYPEFVRTHLRKAAAAMKIPYEDMTGDITQVNYSSIRARVLAYRRYLEAFIHQHLVFQFGRPVVRAWVQQAILTGQISERQFMRNPSAYLRPEWQHQAWPWVDPLKDMQAEVLAVDNLFRSRSSVIRERGDDPDVVDREHSADQQREEALDLKRGAKAEKTPDQADDAPSRNPQQATKPPEHMIV